MLDRDAVLHLVRRALDEDLPDITAESIFQPGDQGMAQFVVKADGVLAGLAFAELTFVTLDPRTRFETRVEDGARVKLGTVVAEVQASVLALLSGERTALNFM